MNVNRDPDLLIKAFLDDGLDELPDRSYEAVRSVIEHTRQRVNLGPWREQQMLNLARFALVAAAVVLVAFLGLRFLTGNTTAPGGSAPPSPSPTPLPSAAALPGGHADLAAGTYRISDTTIAKSPVRLTVPSGWTTDSSIVFKGGDPRVAPVVVAPWLVDHVYSDSCHWSGSLRAVSTAEELINALAGQGSRQVTRPTDVSLGETAATLVELSVPAGFNSASCDEGRMRSWPDPGGDESGGWAALPGEVQRVYVVDSANGPFVVMTGQRTAATADQVAELAAVVDSILIESSD